MAPLLGRRSREVRDEDGEASDGNEAASLGSIPSQVQKKLKQTGTRDSNGYLVDSQVTPARNGTQRGDQASSPALRSPTTQRTAIDSSQAAEEDGEEPDNADIDLAALNGLGGDDDAGGEGEEEEGDEDEDEAAAEERDAEEKLVAERAALRARRIQSGGTRQQGQVISLELVNFMCHANLKMTFGKKLNFVIGHNGSGKSAILTALTIVLGGKANTTGRAPSLKDFIKYGSDAALIGLRLTNGGSEAYRPKDYGDVIQIERRISKDGSSSYTIKNAHGRVVSRERGELTNICEAMNLQVDNPMNILSQDAARQFLSASTPEDKYRQWLRGIQLTQLKEEYGRIKSHLEEIRTIVKHRQKGIPELEDAVRQAKRRFEEMQANNEMRYRFQELHAMIAWAYVEDKEAAVERQKKRCEDVESKIDEIQVSVEADEKRRDELQNVLHQLEREQADEAKKKDPFLAKLATYRKDITQVQRQLQDHKNAMDEMNDNVEREAQQIASYKQRIAEARRKLEAETAGARNALLQRRHNATTELRELEAEQIQVTEEKSVIDEEIAQSKNRIKQLQAEQKSEKDEIKMAESMQANLMASQKDSLAIWGAPMPNLCAAIKRMTNWQEEPLGPIGRYVNVEHSEWVEVLDATLGNHMSSFIVTNNRDRHRLNEIVGQYFKNADRPNIIMAHRDMFEYASGEPDGRFLTMLRALSISDEFVLRQLITTASIEQSILIDRRAEADRIMASPPMNVLNCYTNENGGYKVGGRNGLQQSSALKRNRGGVRFQRNVAAELQKVQEALPGLRQQFHETERSIQQEEDAQKELYKSRKFLDQRQMQLKNRLRAKHQDIQKIEEEMSEAQDVSISSLEDGLRESEQIQQDEIRQRQLLEEVIKTTTSELEPINEKIAAMQTKIDIVDQEIARMREGIQQQRIQVHQIDANISHRRKKLATMEAQKQTATADLESRKADLATKIAQASEVGARVEVTLEIKLLERQLAAAQTQIRNADRRQSQSFEQIQQDFIDKKEALEAAKADFRDMQAFGEVSLARDHTYMDIFISYYFVPISTFIKHSPIALSAGSTFDVRLPFDAVMTFLASSVLEIIRVH